MRKGTVYYARPVARRTKVARKAASIGWNLFGMLLIPAMFIVLAAIGFGLAWLLNYPH